MKNQYFGDVNDYLKYGLLRCFSRADLRVGVCWMLTPDDGRSDGGKTRYLSDAASWRGHDPPLFDTLKSTVGAGGRRHVSFVEDGSTIPNACFFSEIVPDSRLARGAWFDRALKALAVADLLFFDPDNGLEVRSKSYGSRDSSKYLYWREVRFAWERGASLLIFQHVPRERRDPYVERLVQTLRLEATDATVIPLRTPNVLFLSASRPEHGSATKAALDLARSKWNGPITL